MQSSHYDSQIKELLWRESHSTSALRRFRLPTHPTNTFQLQFTHTAAATANALCCYTLTFMTPLPKVYPHASVVFVWVSRVHLKLEYLVSYARHLKDFLRKWSSLALISSNFCSMNTRSSESSIFLGPANVISARLEQIPHDCNNTNIL